MLVDIASPDLATSNFSNDECVRDQRVCLRKDRQNSKQDIAFQNSCDLCWFRQEIRESREATHLGFVNYKTTEVRCIQTLNIHNIIKPIITTGTIFL